MAVDLAYVQTTLVPEVESLKQTYFGGHPDDPVILHRAEIVKRAPPFNALADAAVAARFDRDLLDRFESWAYTVFTVVVDKTALAARFAATRPDPYHRSLELMVSSFATWLEQRGADGDVFAESRGGREDQRLKEAFRQLLESARTVQASNPLTTRLTSRELKVKPKSNNVAGLQLADLIAHPAMLGCLAARNGQGRRADFGGRVMAIIEAAKYARDPGGVIDGTGRLWAP